MKITIIIEGDSENDLEIEVDLYDKIEIISDAICEHLNKKENNFLVYKNIILENENVVSFYKIGQNDEIWCGRIENYWKCGDVILDVFLALWPCGRMINLIVNAGQSIGDIRSIMVGILPDGEEIIDIWNDCGELVNNNQIISEIDINNGGRKIICKLAESDIDRSFEECSYLHDRYLAYGFWWIYYDSTVFGGITWTDETIEQMQNFGEIILSIVATDARFAVDLSLTVRCLRDSVFLCSSSITDRFLDILFGDNRSVIMKTYGDKYGYSRTSLVCEFEHYFNAAIFIVVLDFIALPLPVSGSVRKSMVNLIRDGLQCLMNPSDIWPRVLKYFNLLFLKYRSGDWVKEIGETFVCREYSLVQRQGSSDVEVTIPPETKTIFQIKKVIAMQTGAPLSQIYLFYNECEIKPKDEDMFDPDEDSRFSIHLVQSMADIEILRELGQGAYGKILLCQNKLYKDLFVLKKPLEVDGFDREIINHFSVSEYSSKICLHRGLFNYRGRTCSAMDYKSGGTLGEYIKKNKFLQEHEIARISHQVLKQIKVMHKRRVMHRDIKPDNIVMDENSNAYLIDFGQSKRTNRNIVADHNSIYENDDDYCIDFGQSSRISDVTSGKPAVKKRKSNVGTPIYMAPELMNEQDVNEKIDTWSFGICLIEMVTGNRPYPHLNYNVAFTEIAKSKKIDFKSPYNMSQQMTEFINSCLKANPEERATIEELIQSNFIKKYCDISKDQIL